MSFDYALFQSINQFAGSYPILDFLMVAITDFGVPILAIIALFFCNRKTVYKTLFSGWLVFVIDFALKLLYFRQRPFSSYSVNLLVDHLQTASFPSRHTDLAFAVAAAVFIGDKKLGVLAIAIALLVGISRVFVGVHYPSDVVAGVILGIAGAYFANFVLDKFWSEK